MLFISLSFFSVGRIRTSHNLYYPKGKENQNKNTCRQVHYQGTSTATAPFVAQLTPEGTQSWFAVCGGGSVWFARDWFRFYSHCRRIWYCLCGRIIQRWHRFNIVLNFCDELAETDITHHIDAKYIVCLEKK